MRLLLVEDDPTIAEPLRSGLGREGYDVDHVTTGRAALDAPTPDLVLLDLGLPDMDGHEVCRAIRARSAVPLIVVTARGDEVDRVLLLELGADDYVVKPFGYRELVARIRAVLRRAHVRQESDERAIDGVGDLVIDHRAHVVTAAGTVVELTPKEFDLLAHLAEDPGAVSARERIMQQVWDEHWWGSTKTLDVHVASLRRKLGASRIETVRGVGFRLVDPAGTHETPTIGDTASDAHR